MVAINYDFTTCNHCGGTGGLPTGPSLAAARKAASVSQKEVASRMGVTASYLCDLETGRRDWNYELVEEFERAIKRRRRPPTPTSKGRG
jgi:predicted transcriptional regulator